MYFIVTLENGDTIPLSLNKDDPTDEELIQLFRHSIPAFSEKKQYAAVNHVGECIIYDGGFIYRIAISN